MQNNNSKNSKAKRFYAIVAVCALIIGVSGYFFFSDASEEQSQIAESLSVPTQAQTDAAQMEELPAKEPQEQPHTPAKTAVEETVLPVTGQLLQDFSVDKLAYNQTTRDWRIHGGVDLTAQLGQQVKAARSGTVMAVYEDEYYGNTVVLQHADGYTTTYSGLAEEVPVSAGEHVTAGQTIATVGTTALVEKALEPHLHFEVSKNGEPIDPAGFLY